MSVCLCVCRCEHSLLCMLMNTVDYNNNDNEILVKRKPLVCTRAQRTVHKKKKKKKERLGQYNSNNKLIHGQYTSRYNLHLSHSLT